MSWTPKRQLTMLRNRCFGFLPFIAILHACASVASTVANEAVARRAALDALLSEVRSAVAH